MSNQTHVKLVAKPDSWFKEGTEVYSYDSSPEKGNFLRATYTGNWKEVEECCNQDNQLDQEYARSISPEPVGHPDNPIFG